MLQSAPESRAAGRGVPIRDSGAIPAAVTAHRFEDEAARINRLIADIDDLLNDQVNAILHHPRVKALEAAGVLTRTVRLVDPAAVGRGVNVLCNVRMRSHAIEARQAFEAFVDGRPEIVESFSMSGEWDYLLRIVVADVSDYNHFLMQVMLGHPSVAGASSHFALSMTKYTTAIPV